MARYLLIPSMVFDPETGEITCEMPRIIEGPESYPLIRDAVEGWIERIPLQDEQTFDLWCNEEYIYHWGENPEFRENPVATALQMLDPLGAECLAAHPLGFIAGPCVITGGCDDDGGTLDVPDAVVGRVLAYAAIIVPHVLDAGPSWEGVVIT